MIDRFPDSPHELDALLGEFARDMQEQQEFVATKAALYAQLMLLHSGDIAVSAEQSVTELIDMLDEHVDKFIMVSHTILSRRDKNVAVGEWIKFITTDDADQQERAYAITGFDLVSPLTAAQLPHHAWSYIKQYRLDTYNDYGLDNHPDLDNEEWIVQGYRGRQHRRVSAILDYAPDFITTAAAESELDDMS